MPFSVPVREAYADDGAETPQRHGVGREGSFIFSGEECKPWYGHRDGGYTVAGNPPDRPGGGRRNRGNTRTEPAKGNWPSG